MHEFVLNLPVKQQSTVNRKHKHLTGKHSEEKYKSPDSPSSKRIEYILERNLENLSV